MHSFPIPRRFVAISLLLGLLTQDILLAAGPQEPAVTPPKLEMHDVQLSADGRLTGIVVDVQGQMLKEIEVVLSLGGKEMAKQTTDTEGRFSFPNVKGGSYQLVTSAGVCGCRAWTAEAAPPSAARQIMIVHGTIVRGQKPIREMFRTDPIFAAAILAAAIAIPIAIRESQSDSPTGS